MTPSRQFSLVGLFGVVTGCALLSALLASEGGRNVLLFCLAFAYLFAPLYLTVVASLLSRCAESFAASTGYLLVLYLIVVGIACCAFPGEEPSATCVVTLVTAILWSVEFFFLWSVDRLFKYCFPDVKANATAEQDSSPDNSDRIMQHENYKMQNWSRSPRPSHVAVCGLQFHFFSFLREPNVAWS